MCPIGRLRRFRSLIPVPSDFARKKGEAQTSIATPPSQYHLSNLGSVHMSEDSGDLHRINGHPAELNIPRTGHMPSFCNSSYHRCGK